MPARWWQRRQRRWQRTCSSGRGRRQRQRRYVLIRCFRRAGAGLQLLEDDHSERMRARLRIRRGGAADSRYEDRMGPDRTLRFWFGQLRGPAPPQHHQSEEAGGALPYPYIHGEHVQPVQCAGSLRARRASLHVGGSGEDDPHRDRSSHSPGIRGHLQARRGVRGAGRDGPVLLR